MTYTPEIEAIIKQVNDEKEAQSGYDRLWGWFGLSRASFCVLPRVLMHEMPDEWQRKMAVLLEEYDDTWNDGIDGGTTVNLKVGNKFASWPEWVLNYRRPDHEHIATLRRNPTSTQVDAVSA